MWRTTKWLRLFFKRKDVWHWAHGSNTMRIDGWVGLGVVFFDMFKIGCFMESRNFPIQKSDILVQISVITSDGTNVTLEVLNINWIKSGNGWIKSDISFSQTVTNEIKSVFFLGFFAL